MAYEKIEKVLNNLYFINDENDTLRFAVFDKLENYNNLLASISDAIKSSMWLTVNSKKYLYAINQNLADVRKGKNYEDSEQLKIAGILAYKAMSANKNNLELLLHRDIHNLYDIERFFRLRN